MQAIMGAPEDEDIGERMEAILSAPQHEDIVNLYSQIRQHRDFLHDFEKRRFTDTPLHSAARRGRTQLALEIQRLVPSFGTMLNSQGFSPLHLALLGGHRDTVSEMVKQNPELVRVQGKMGMTPLHYAALVDNHLLAEFLLSCPESIDDLTIRGESALHLAVKNRQFEAFMVLFGWLQKISETSVLGWRDCNGDTVLHVAASTNQTQVVEHLVAYRSLINDKNSRGYTALDILENTYPVEPDFISRAKRMLLHRGAKHGVSIPRPRYSTLADCLSSQKQTFMGSLIRKSEYARAIQKGETRTAILMVAIFIVTTTYQAMLKPPSGISTAPNITINTQLSSANATTNTTSANITTYLNSTALPANITTYTNSTGLHVNSYVSATSFAILNSAAFGASVGMIFSIFPVLGRNIFVHPSLIFLVLSYIAAMKLTYVEAYVEYPALTGWYVFFIVVLYLAFNLSTKFYLLCVRRKASVSRRLAGSNHFINDLDVIALLSERSFSDSSKLYK